MNQPKQLNHLLSAIPRWLLLVAVLLGLAATPALAQTQKITGKVTDETGAPVTGATVREKGGKKGTFTDAEGKFTLQVKPGTTLIVSGIGVEAREVAVGTETDLSIQMKGKSSALNEVVVTALGIKREKRQLTYSTQEVKGDVITGTKETGILNSLTGKVSGVQITSSSGQPGASSRIVIRGNSSLTGDNQALIIMDGVPINNSQTGNAGGGNGSSRLSDIDPATIESINVLKGSAASALYGSAAARGVVLITTKGGAFNSRPKVTINSQYSFENAIKPQMQTKYALGDRGVYYDGETQKTSAVWGPSVDSLRQVGLLKYYKNPMDAFFVTGRTFTNTASVNGGNDKASYFFSYSNLDQKGIVPTTNFQRNSLFAKYTNKLTSQITASLQATYTMSATHSIPEGYDLNDPLWTIYTAPATWNPLPYLDSTGAQRVFRPSRNNPFWNLYNVYNNTKISRFIPVFTVNYKPLDWLTFTERIGLDTYSEQPDYYEAPSSTLNTTGTITQRSGFYRQYNHDFIAQANKTFGDLDVTFILGNNINSIYSQTHSITGSGITILGFDNVSNGSTIQGSQSYSERRKVGFYAQANLDYKRFLNLSFTGRYDGSSVLSTEKMFFPYGSASAGFVFSELAKVPAISFGKLRVSYSAVGNDNVGAYALTTPFNSATNFPYGGNSGFLRGTGLGNPDLHNERTNEMEIGLEMNFLRNRFGFEVSYFDRHHKDLLTSGVPLAPATGYNSTTLNAADMTNKGVEVLLNVTPVKTKNFTWDMTINYTRIRNKVTKIFGNTQQLANGQTWLMVGKPYGVFYNYGYQRDTASGQILIDDAGLPKISSGNVIIGNLQADFTAGLQSNFSYKNWSVSVFFDYRKGGDIMNSDDRYGYFYGTPKVTENREPRVVQGIVASTKQQNTKVVQAEDYYQRINTIYEAAIQDGTYLKFRTASITYKLPVKMLAKTAISGASLSATGRNLFIHAPHFTGSDPEVSSYGTGNDAQGLYGNTVPTSRAFNVTLNVSFK
ncbi:MAG: SusC/RagA family TonB-linked outer membrane protein [Bacteroidetes bacterium]|nr:SusC/RagA family TonB-linked outer membrane protein [Bacteroidota bacterium]